MYNFSYLERRYRVIHFSFCCCSRHLPDSVHYFLDIYLRIVKHGQGDESTFLVRGLLVYAIPDNSSLHNGRFHVLLAASSPYGNGSHSITDLHLMIVSLPLLLIL